MSGCNCSESQITVLTGEKGDPGSVPGVVTTGGVGGSVTLTTAQSGMTFVFDSTVATLVTLPAASVGLTYTFVSTATPAVGNTVTAPGALYTGGIISIEDGTAPAYFAPDVVNDNIITLNGTTTGGLPGNNFTLTCYVANRWAISGTMIASLAPTATPFS